MSGFVVKNIFELKGPCAYILHRWGRYDIFKNTRIAAAFIVWIYRWKFFIWHHSEDKLNNKFLEHLDHLKNNHKLTHEISRDNIIIYLNVSVRDSNLLTDLYFKEADCRQTPCLERNCTFENDFNQHLANTKECFFLHGYPEKMVK